jgi:hypothetical protein
MWCLELQKIWESTIIHDASSFLISSAAADQQDEREETQLL